MENEGIDKDGILFRRLIFTFQTAAMQQMGKLVDPVAGRVARDLEQAALSIDTLDMLSRRCRGNLTADESRILDLTISELKLNNIDEIGRPEPQPEVEKGAESPPEQDANAQKPAE